MSSHINKDGLFQSDKYPTCPAGKVPLSVKDESAQDLLWEYAQRRRSVDAEFSADLEQCLLKEGYKPKPVAKAYDFSKFFPPPQNIDREAVAEAISRYIKQTYETITVCKTCRGKPILCAEVDCGHNHPCPQCKACPTQPGGECQCHGCKKTFIGPINPSFDLCPKCRKELNQDGQK